MKKYYLAIAAVFTSLMLTACAMTPEEITTYMTSAESSYMNGIYEQAQSEVQTLEKSYKNMTDEQKTKFDDLKSSVEYAVKSASSINDRLDNAQNMLDGQQYYEAAEELEKIAQEYTLPPFEQGKLDEKKAAADNGIKSWEATESMQKAQTMLNSGDYSAAAEELNNVDSSILSEDQQNTYNSLQTNIAAAKSAAEAKAAANAKAKAEAARKANEGISASQAKTIAANAFGMSASSVTITDEGSYYSAAGSEWDDFIGSNDEAGCKIDKKTGKVYDRVG